MKIINKNEGLNINYVLMPIEDRKKYHCAFCGSRFVKYYYKSEHGTGFNVPACSRCALLKGISNEE